jgi:outer membrane receptor protein involved in Fe transport
MRSLLIAAGLALATTYAGVARADDTSSIEGFLEEEVVTAASKSSQQASDAPALSRSISSEEIRRYGIRSLDEAINFLAPGLRTTMNLRTPEIAARGVQFTGTQLYPPESFGGVDPVGARGVQYSGDQGNHVLLLIDGHSLNEPVFGSAQYGQGVGIPLELIDHIEIVLGPGSAIYGSNAVLGVINVVTKTAANPGSHAVVEVTPASELRTTFTSAHSFDLLGSKNSVVTGLTYYEKEGPTLDLGPQDAGNDPVDNQPMKFSPIGPRTGIWGGEAKNSYYTRAPGMHLRFNRGRFELMVRASHLHHGDPGSRGDFDDARNGVSESRASIVAKQRFPIPKFGEIAVRAFADAFQWRQDFVSSSTIACPFSNARVANIATCRTYSIADSTRLGMDALATLDWTHDGRFTTQLGGSGMLNTVVSTFHRTDADTGRATDPALTVVPENTLSVLSISGQQNFRPWKWMTLNAGARVDRDERFPVIASPRVMAQFVPWEGSTLKLIHAEAFRAPTYLETNGFTPLIIKARDLEPEHVASEELVIEQRLGAQRLALGLFYMRYDSIVRPVLLTPPEAAAAVANGQTTFSFTPRLELYQLRNVDEIRSYGYTAAYDGSVANGKLRFGANLTGAVAYDRFHAPITVAPRLFGNARVSYDLGGALPTLAVASTWASRSVVDRAYDGRFQPIPHAPPQLELRAAITGQVPAVSGLSYRVIANHAFHDQTAYAIGPVTRTSVRMTQPELAPIQSWMATVGLQYDF